MELTKILEHLPVRMGDRHLVICPLYHSGAQAFTLIHAALGCTIYLRPHFTPEDALDCLVQKRIHSVFIVPTMIHAMLADDTLNPGLFPDLRCLVSGAAPFPHALRTRAMNAFGRDRVFDFYGATELGWVTLIGGPDMQDRPSSVGRALPGQTLHIMRDDAEVATGEVGKIYVENKQLMQGYLDDEKANQDSRRGAWATVDDLGWVDEDGYLYLAGRDRDMIISGGVNVYPIEVESALLDHPHVAEAAVFGIADAKWGEVVAVAICLGKGADMASIQAWASTRLSGSKVPRRWFQMDALPRNPTGKVLKRELQEEFG